MALNRSLFKGRGMLVRLSLAGTVCLFVIGLAFADPSWSSMKHPTHVDAQGLGPALEMLAREHGFQVLYRTEVVGSFQTRAVEGELTTDEALHQLLSGTGLTYRYLDERAVTIVPVSTTTGSGGSAATSPSSRAPDQTRQEGKKDSSGAFLLAQAAPGQASTSGSVESQRKQAYEGQIQEVIVTAQKREERRQDVPVPVTAINASTLVDNNQVQITQYYSQVPGLNLTVDGVRGTPDIAIRGINSGQSSNPTVGITIDDVPFGSSTALGGGYNVPDLDPSDLSRIEVLRGPQGTLYGASSLGGLLKFVTADPSIEEVNGRVEAGTSGVENGAQPGYSFRGSVNVPLGDSFALRANAFTRQDPGYIDDPGLLERGVNWGTAEGGHLSTLWRPNDDISLKLSALLQESNVHGSNAMDQLAGLGDLQQSDTVRNVGGYSTNAQLYSANLTAKIGQTTLTSLTGYGINRLSDSFDWTYQFGLTAQALSGVAGAPYYENDRTNKFSQEIRLAFPVGASIDGLIGVFYTHESSTVRQTLYGVDPDTGATAGTLYDSPISTTFEEYAAFADMTFRVTQAFDVQVGARESQNRQTYTQILDGAFFGTSIVVDPEEKTKDNSFTYLVTPRYRLSQDFMVYARLASGYQPGGPNAQAITSNVPISYKPDTTHNYELGVKGSAFNHEVSFDVSIYDIEWNDIQLQVIPQGGGSYYTNGSGARSKGGELSVEVRPLKGLTLAAWVAITDATLSQAFPPTSVQYGVPGDRLPFNSKFSGNLSIQDEFPLSGSLQGVVGGSVAYVGDRSGNFQGFEASGAPMPRQYYPAYARTDLHAGLRYTDAWTLNVYANNVTDRRGLLSGGVDNRPPYSYVFITPRTIGLTVARMF